MTKPKPRPELGDDEIGHRRDAALLRALSTPHKRQKEMRVGKRVSVSHDPTILALRRALDREAAAFETGEKIPETIVGVILACLPKNVFRPVLLPARGAGAPLLAISVSDRFDGYMAFAAEYYKNLIRHSSN